MDFQGNSRIKIQPHTENYPIRFIFPIAPSVDGGGAIPYGNTIVSAQIKAYDPDGLDVSAQLVDNVYVPSSNVVTATLSYFTGAKEGAYKLTVILELSSGEYTDEFDATRRVVVKDT